MDLDHIKTTMPGSGLPGGLLWIERKAEALPQQMAGMTVLDIGAYNGYYSLICASRGAKVLSLDVVNEWRNLELYNEFKDEHQLDCEHKELDVYDLDQLDEVFDLVIFYDVFYHLESPMDALRKIIPKVRRALLLSTYIIDSRFADVDQTQPLMYFFEPRELRKIDPTNIWGPTTACVEKMLKVAGFQAVKMLSYIEDRAIFRATKSTLSGLPLWPMT